MKKQPDELHSPLPPSHHELPKRPGSDHDHLHEEERNKERKRVWDERHHHESHPPK